MSVTTTEVEVCEDEVEVCEDGVETEDTEFNDGVRSSGETLRPLTLKLMTALGLLVVDHWGAMTHTAHHWGSSSPVSNIASHL